MGKGGGGPKAVDRAPDKLPDPMYPQVFFKRIGVPKDWPIPSRARDGDAGYDLRTVEGGSLAAGELRVFSTGIQIAILCQQGRTWEGQIRPRSGLAAKGLMVANSPGTIDLNYRGELKLILLNASGGVIGFAAGDRVAQLVFNEVGIPHVYDCDNEHWDFPGDTDRGANGLGSTGEK